MQLNKYAMILSASDVKQMFMLLTKIMGSKSKAARKCGIERTLIYDWTNETDMRLQTKIKVINVAIKKAPNETLSILLKRSKEVTVDVLRTLIRNLYKSTIHEDISQEQLKKQIAQILMIYEQNAGLILYQLEKQAEDILMNLKKKAEYMNVIFPERSLDLIKAKHLLELLPILTPIIESKATNIEDIAKDFYLPIEFIETLNAIMNPTSFKKNNENILLPNPYIDNIIECYYY